MPKDPLQLELIQYVFDASALINMEQDGDMHLLRKLRGAILIPERVATRRWTNPGNPCDGLSVDGQA